LVTCGLTALAGVVLGFIAMNRIRKSNGQLGGHGVALAGTIVSGCLLLMMPMMAGMLLPALAKAREKATSMACMNNTKQLNLALMMYAEDHNGTFPSTTTWCDSIQSYLGGGPGPFLCPLGPPNQRSHYALNSAVAGAAVKDIREPARTVLVFETDGGWNVAGSRELLPSKGRHGGAYIVGFADGHVEMVRPEHMGQRRWSP
jgi:prepilin-type processing-associated H-X9-DG protein